MLSYEKLIRPTKCGIKNAVDKNDFIIKQFQEKNGEKYTYEKVNYKNDYEYVIVTCKEHGDFNVSPTHHKQNTVVQHPLKLILSIG